MASIGLIVGLYLALLGAPFLGAPVKTTVLNVLRYGGPLAFLLSCRWALRKAPKDAFRSQRWWASTLVIGGVVGGIVSDLIDSGLASALGPVLAGPPASQALRLVSCIVLAVGIIRVPRDNLTGRARARVLLDSLMLSVAAVTVAWYAALGPFILDEPSAGPAAWGRLVLPALDLVLACTIANLWLKQTKSAARTTSALLLGGVSLVLAGDLLASLPDPLAGPTMGRLLSATWMVGAMLLILGSLSVRFGPRESVTRELRAASFWQTLLPNAAAPVLFAVLADGVWYGVDKRLVFGVLAGSVATLAILLVRQVMALLESRGLNYELADAVEQLQAQSEHIEAQNNELRALNTELEDAFRDLEEANRRLNDLATTDGLTGLYNLRSFLARLEEEAARAGRASSPLSVVMVDVDHFKSYNDSFGHQVGDEVLKEVANALKTQLRKGDFLARYGGEEFVAILPDTPEDTALVVAERMRKKVQGLRLEHRPVTASFGCAVRAGADEPTFRLTERADLALYAAKKLGRNRVERYSELPALAAHTDASSVPYRGRESAAGSEGVERLVAFLDRLEPGVPLTEGERNSVRALVAAFELRAAEEPGHAPRVAWMGLRLALAMHAEGRVTLSAPLVREVALGCLLHDVGMIGVSDIILQKPAKLDAYEAAAMKRHPALGVDLLGSFPDLVEAVPVVLHHHEWWNGSGYPDRLTGESIPFAARVCSVADALEAMTSERRYHKLVDVAQAVQEVAEQSGVQFDPALVHAAQSVPDHEWEAIKSGDVEWLEAKARGVLRELRRSA